jgi:hypothetical protein
LSLVASISKAVEIIISRPVPGKQNGNPSLIAEVEKIVCRTLAS